MDNATFMFELLLRNHTFMGKIDSYILTTHQIDDIPQLVLNLTELLQINILYNNLKQKTTLHLDDMYNLMELYRIYIFNKAIKYNIIVEKQLVKCTEIYNICVKLAVLQLPVSTKQKKWCVI